MSPAEETALAPAAEWWQSAVIYQVYPRSFADGDGDGVGDLAGLTARLPYIASLGVDGIWMTPFQPSPQVDQGYDVSDYCGVDPLFGTMEQFDTLLELAHSLGLRVLLDVVPNHCSAEHPLFQAALAAGPGSRERDMFHFVPGPVDMSDDGGPGSGAASVADIPPNNWQSVFGGRAWSRADPGSATDTDWYLHLFSPEQPDWNWRNPAVGDYFDGVLSFWFDKGVDGLRIDVAHALFKADGLPDSPSTGGVVDGLRSNPQVSDQEEVHEVYRRWRTLAEKYEPHRLLVGEVNLEPARAARYTRADEMQQAFAFAFVKLGWDPEAWAAVGNELEAARQLHGATPTWALENHDIVRSVTRFGGGEVGALRARASLVALLGLPGPAYLYQGQELGLPEVDVPLEARVDPMWARGGVCRDGARIPLPWTADAALNHGFSLADPAAAVHGPVPWLPQPEGWGTHAIERQEQDPASALNLTKAALGLRRKLWKNEIFGPDDGGTWRVEAGNLLICTRGEHFFVAVAMGSEPVQLPAGTVLLSTEPLAADGWLQPNNAAWVLRH
ncbi:alpha-amylase family glycosyl hydrolase [Arthrobacter sp. AL08]|uniref:alpha-amylase family glycosyl hydrolase n=1 Tax=unclassified Arthrobacter TaxID=235627 RepID=UPI00249A2807|nr:MULTISPECIES: alpha-amylase family glycosyl hydrolase [unclassified Arthrobacter]MDI3242228.1 alpha-amylase family glycosyl hydrolase [Arthrobacter sp. AL05]MDI3278166.1 alpha-amylase family glycosyl hydrolase [Arthrobacter sp. AL08]